MMLPSDDSRVMHAWRAIEISNPTHIRESSYNPGSFGSEHREYGFSLLARIASASGAVNQAKSRTCVICERNHKCVWS